METTIFLGLVFRLVHGLMSVRPCKREARTLSRALDILKRRFWLMTPWQRPPERPHEDGRHSGCRLFGVCVCVCTR